MSKYIKNVVFNNENFTKYRDVDLIYSLLQKILKYSLF